MMFYGVQKFLIYESGELYESNEGILIDLIVARRTLLSKHQNTSELMKFKKVDLSVTSGEKKLLTIRATSRERSKLVPR